MKNTVTTRHFANKAKGRKFPLLLVISTYFVTYKKLAFLPPPTEIFH